ncbi:MAG TPA: iron-containing redox enzyme family protein [Chloroflexota bacterium]
MAVATGSRFLDEIKDEINSSQWSSIRHPLVVGVSQGTVPLRQIRGWAIQDSHYRRMVYRLASLRYLRCTDADIQRRLAGVVAEEAEGTDTGSAGHYQLFLRFARAIGLSEEEVQNGEPLPATAAHIYWAELILWALPWPVAMAAQVAGEGQAPITSRMMSDGLQKHYGLSAEEAAFFDVHVEADDDHRSLAEEIVTRYIVTSELQDQARAVVRRKLKLMYDMRSTFEAF